jgi:predicted enzyme related to lactoylglutathione lyase
VDGPRGVVEYVDGPRGGTTEKRSALPEMIPALDAPAPNGVVLYILAPDMDATIAAIEAAGGEIVIPRTDVMGMGEFAHFRDPDGNLIGLWRE